MTIGKSDFIDVIATSGGLTKAKATQVWEALRDSIAAAIHHGDSDVVLFGLAKISVKECKARTGRNPATGAEIQIPASKKLKVKTLAPAKEILARAA